MFTVENTVTIGKPVSEVFAFINAPDSSPKWQSGVDAVEYDGPMQAVGTQYTEVRKFMGREMRTTLEITALEPDRKFAAKTLSGPVSYEVTVTFEADNGGTKMTTVVTAEPGGFFKLAEGAVKKQLEESLAQDGETLKKLLES